MCKEQARDVDHAFFVGLNCGFWYYLKCSGQNYANVSPIEVHVYLQAGK